MGYWEIESRNMNVLQREHLPHMTYHAYYSEKKILEQAEVRISQEIKDLEQSLGEEMQWY